MRIRLQADPFRPQSQDQVNPDHDRRRERFQVLCRKFRVAYYEINHQLGWGNEVISNWLHHHRELNEGSIRKLETALEKVATQLANQTLAGVAEFRRSRIAEASARRTVKDSEATTNSSAPAVVTEEQAESA